MNRGLTIEYTYLGETFQDLEIIYKDVMEQINIGCEKIFGWDIDGCDFIEIKKVSKKNTKKVKLN